MLSIRLLNYFAVTQAAPPERLALFVPDCSYIQDTPTAQQNMDATFHLRCRVPWIYQYVYGTGHHGCINSPTAHRKMVDNRWYNLDCTEPHDDYKLHAPTAQQNMVNKPWHYPACFEPRSGYLFIAPGSTPNDVEPRSGCLFIRPASTHNDVEPRSGCLKMHY